MKTKTNPQLSLVTCHRSLNLLGALFCFALLSSGAFAQNVNVNPGALTYPDLASAFTAINNGVHTGAVTVDIVGNTAEVGTATLNASGTGAANYSSVVISPSGGAARSISGSIAGPLIDLNGADNVTINGLNTGGNSLSIVNTLSAATPSTIRFINDATNNLVTNCTIAGAGTATTLGTIFFSTTTGATGNFGNTISNSNITSVGGASVATNAIYSLGTAGKNNTGTITGNNISDYFNAASVSIGINIAATGNTAWTITNNKLFQTATRIYTTSNTHNGIFVGTGDTYTITGNTIGFADANGNGTTNIVGNTVALTGTFPTAYTTTGTANATRYIAINCAFTAGAAASSIQNNTIAGIALYTSSGAATTNGILCGINVTSGNANIGTTTANTIGATNGGGGASPASLYSATTTTGGTIVGIFATSTNTVTIQNNTIGSVDAVGTTATISGGFTGIDAAGAAGVFSITNNTIGNSSADNIRTGFTQTGANLSNSGALVSTTGATGAQVGIRNAATGATLSISNNTLRGWAVGGTVTAVTGIINSGAVTTTISLNSNALGTAGLGWVRYAFANSGTLTGVSATGAGAASALTINSNDIRGITYSALSTGANTYINCSGVPLSFTTNLNTFTNLNVNTSGTCTFVLMTYTQSTATGTKTVTNNSIVTAYNRGGASGSTLLVSDNGSSVTGVLTTVQSNNFSNITVAGTSTITGINLTDGGTAPTKSVTGNTLSSWTAITGAINAVNITYLNGASSISTNTITNLTGQSTVTGMTFGSTVNTANPANISSNTINNLSSTGTGGAVTGITCANTSTTININGNTINTLSSTGAATSNGIAVTGATTTNVFKNKICDISGSNASTLINGILVSAGTTVNVYNNLIGDLRAPIANAANPVVGLNITGGTTVNAFYNTVRLAASSSGANFGTSAVSVSTTPTVTLRNNIFVNLSTPNGTGLTVAHRRSTTTLTSYGSTSNNNDFYAGTPGASNLIFNDGTNSDQTIGAYKTRVASRDSASFTENPTFLSIACGTASFLHMDPSVPTQIESGGSAVTSPINITDDFDGDTRNASTPDVGADEFNGIAIDMSPPVISYATLGNDVAAANRSFTNVTVTDATGVNTTAGTRPRVYYKRSTDANTFNDNTNGTDGWKFAEASGVGGSPFSFTIDYSLLNGGTGVVVGNIVQYFVVAQDTVTPTPNVGINSGTFAANPSSVALTAAAFPIGGSINSYNIVNSLSGTFTVGAGGNYPSLTGANGAITGTNGLNNSILNGPVVFNLIENSNAPEATETYPITINANPGSSAMNTVTIKPASGSTVTINPAAGSTTAIFKFNGCSYVTIDGSNNNTTSRDLTITNSSTTGPNAVVWIASNGTGLGSTNCTVKNSNITGGNSTGTATYGIFVGGSSIVAAGSGADNDNTTIQNNVMTGATIGVYANGTASVSNGGLDSLTVTGNNITSNSSLQNYAIEVGNALNSTISQNTVSVTSSGAVQPTGISIETGFVSSVVSRNLITNVLATNTGGYGGRGITVGTGTATSNLQVSNNMVYGVNGSNWNSFVNSSSMGIGIGVTGGGSLTTTTGGVGLYFNSVNMTGSMGSGSTTAITGALYIGTGVTTLDARDNIFVNTQTATSTTQKNYAVYDAGTNAVFSTTNYNDYFVSNSFNAGSALVGFLTSDRANLAAWQTATGQDANSKSVDPVFTSATDLHLQGTTTLGAMGITIGGIAVDFDGQTRANPPFIGADEIPASPGTLQFSSATYSVTEQGLTATITVTRANGSQGAASVMYQTSDGSATGGAACGGMTDYITTSGTLMWADMDAAPKQFTVTVCNDGVTEPNETVNLALSNATGAALGTPNTAVLTIINSEAFNGSYTIGAGGSYPSLTGVNGALTALNNGYMTGPVVFNLIENSNAPEATEAYPITINAISGSSAANTLTIKPAVGQTVTITGSVASGPIFKLNGASNVIIDGSNTVGGTTRDLTITNTNATSPSVILFGSIGTTPFTNDTLKNCVIVNGANTSSAVVVSDAATLGNPGYFSNVTIQNNSVQKAFIGVYATGGTTPQNGSNLVYTQNDLSTSGANAIRFIGLYMQGVNGATVTQNTVGNFSGTESEDDKGIWLATGTINATVDRNTIKTLKYTGTGGYGCHGVAVSTGVTGANIQISNNMLYDLSGDGFDYTGSFFADNPFAIYAFSTQTGVKIYFNSINLFGNTLNQTNALSAGIVLGTGTTADVRDNAIVNNLGLLSATGLGSTGVWLQTAASQLSPSNYNDYFVNPTGSGVKAIGKISTTTTSTTLAQWQAATGQEAQSLNVNPGYVSNTNLHLSTETSPVANVGTSLAPAVTTDFDGDSRSVTRPDIGADEIASNYLSALTLSMGTLAPPFDPNTTSYTANVSNATNCITVTPTSVDSNSLIEVQVNGGGFSTVPSGTPSSCLALNVGANTVEVRVTPEFGPNGPPTLPTAGTPRSYTVMVTRAAPTYTVTYDGNGSTGGTPPMDGNAYFQGDTVTVLAPGSLVRACYTFAHWNTAADDSGTSYNPGQMFTMPGNNVTLYAQWTINTYTLTYTTDGNGTIMGTNPQTVNCGSNGTAVTAVPNACYHFVQWSDGVLTATRTDMNVMADHTYQAQFAINTYTLTYTAGANGSLTGMTSQMVNCGANGTAVTAVPDACYHFTMWSDGVLTATRTDMNVMGDITVQAQFAINTYTLTYTAGANGSLTGTTSQMVNCGSDGTAVTAVPNAGYHFVNWSDASTQNPRTDTNVMANISVTANFAINTYTVTYDGNTNTGGMAPVDPNSPYNHGATVTVLGPGTLTKTGFTFAHWNTAADDSGTSYNPGNTFTITSNTTLFAQWSPAPVTTNGGSGLAINYSSLAAAITALNGTTMTSPVVITLTGNETAPAGGYAITQQGGTAANTITIQGSASTITANAGLTAGALNDAIFKLIGANWVTLQSFTMQENPANTTTTVGTNNMTEWGVALLHASTTQGSQSNTIQNNTISLNKTYGNTFGVYANNRHSAVNVTVAEEVVNNTTGPQSNNKVYNNGISNVAHGIVFIGSGTAANMDVNNDIGGSFPIDSPNTPQVAGNNVTNYGGLPAATAYVGFPTTIVAGAYILNENNYNLSNNSFISAALNTATALRGILTDYTAAPVGAITNNILNNTVTFTQAGAGGLQAITTASTIGAISNVTQNTNSNKAINNAVNAANAVTIFGVANLGAYGTLNMNNNEVSGNTSAATTGGFVGVTNQGAVVNTVNIMNNAVGTETVNAVTFSAATTAGITGISNTAGAATATLNVTGNFLRRFSLVSTGQFAGIIQQAAAIGVAMNLNNNHLGTATSNLYTYSAASANNVFGIVNAAGAATATLTISGNDLRGFVNNVPRTAGGHNYINNQVFTGSTNISNNTLTNITDNAGGTSAMTMIANNVTHAANTTHNVNNNSIVGSYTRTGGSGQIAYYNSFSLSGSTVTEINTGNNFSNMNFTGTTGTNIGWRSADGTTPGSRKTITNNTFSNIIGGTGAMTSILYVGFSDQTFANNNVSGNVISNVSNGNSISAIFSDGQNQNFFNNTIGGLSATGAGAAVIGIQITGATTQNIFKNKIFDLQSNNATGAVNGIAISAGTTVNVFNNLIGDLRTPATNAANSLIGLNVTGGTTVNAYYNTVYLNASSSGAVFGSSAASISTTPTVTLRNNVFVNTSTANGGALTVAHRRSSTTLTTYGNASDNNDFYAGTPGIANLIYNDGTSSDQTIAAYKARVAPRDAASFTENPPFLSTVGTSANFLHINPSVATRLESRAVNIAGITDDFDGDIRQGNPGYVGSGTAPDVGGDEFNGTPMSSNAMLSNLTLSSGMLTPPFDPNTTSYTATVSFSTTSITETPTAQDANATITVNGQPVPSGMPSQSIPLAVGMNTVTTVVTAQDGTMKTYTVVVTRSAPSTNADLSNLTVSQGMLQPAFMSNVTSYTDSVGNAVTSMTVTPTAADANATITVNGMNVPSGMPSQVIPLNEGNTLISIVVTAQDTTTMKTYMITVHRTPSVSNGNDSGPGSLRQALANSQDGDVITFGGFVSGTPDHPVAPNVPLSTVTLTSAELMVTTNVTIMGSGANVLTVTRDGMAPNFRIFHVAPGKTVTISGMTISNGQVTGGSYPGGAGGGIYNDHGNVTVTGCALNGNQADYGGGLFNDGVSGTGSMQATSSTIAGNTAFIGGGIMTSGEGGTATMSINNCTVSGNSVTGGGDVGGIYNDATASSSNAALQISNSTLSGNNGGSLAGGIANNASGGSVATLDIGNTILKKGTTGPNLVTFAPAVTTSHGYNLSDDNGGGSLTGTGDQINTDPMLGPLKDNGGTTLTHAPLINSPALDQGKRDTIMTLATNFDQRGGARPVDDGAVTNAGGGDASDIGAVELGANEFVHPTDANSRKTHDGAGDFDVNLPLGTYFAATPLGIECRSGGTTGVYQVRVTFAGNVTLTGAAVNTGTGTVGSTAGSGTNVITINLTGVTDVQSLTLALFDVDDGSSITDVGVKVRIHLGDVTANDVVNSSDVSMAKGELGNPVSGANFRSDVNTNGSVTSSDIALIKSKIP